MSNQCPMCEKTLKRLTVELKQADISPVWQVSCPECGGSLSAIETQFMADLVALE